MYKSLKLYSKTPMLAIFLLPMPKLTLAYEIIDALFVSIKVIIRVIIDIKIFLVAFTGNPP
jgi:hypothetical protein